MFLTMVYRPLPSFFEGDRTLTKLPGHPPRPGSRSGRLCNGRLRHPCFVMVSRRFAPVLTDPARKTRAFLGPPTPDLLAAGRLGFCQQFFRFAQEALSLGRLAPSADPSSAPAGAEARPGLPWRGRVAGASWRGRRGPRGESLCLCLVDLSERGARPALSYSCPRGSRPRPAYSGSRHSSGSS